MTHHRSNTVLISHWTLHLRTRVPRAWTSVPPFDITTVVPTFLGMTIVSTPYTTYPSTPLIARSTTSSHRHPSCSRSSGGGCCGGSAKDAMTPPHEHPLLLYVDSTPMGSSSTTPWGAHDHDNNKIYIIRDEVPIMKTQIWQLRTVQFHNFVITLWDQQDKEKKNYINTKIKKEFLPSNPRNPVSNECIQYIAHILMVHYRLEARDAFRKGKDILVCLDGREWEGRAQEVTETPEKFQQQREVARMKLQTIGASHFGSGGYKTMHHEFVSICNRFVYLNVCSNVGVVKNCYQ